MKNRSNRSVISHEEIIKRYLNKESSIKISRSAQISPTAVLSLLKRKGVKMRSKEEAERLKRKYNHELIVQSYKNGMSLIEVSKRYGIDPSNALKLLKKRGLSSRGVEARRRGANHPFWKGGITKDHYGYAIQKEGKVHRIVMEKHLGRKLNHWESVHHVNGDKKNYSLENLVVMPEREHARFHLFLRFTNQKISEDVLKKYGRNESNYVWRFTTDDFAKIETRQ